MCQYMTRFHIYVPRVCDINYVSIHGYICSRNIKLCENKTYMIYMFPHMTHYVPSNQYIHGYICSTHYLSHYVPTHFVNTWIYMFPHIMCLYMDIYVPSCYVSIHVNICFTHYVSIHGYICSHHDHHQED